MTPKIRLTTLSLFIWLIGFGQELPKQKSARHVQIKGTNIFMIPPDQYQASPNFKGFQNPTDQTSMIMAMELPGPYAEVTKGFNAQDLQSRGMVIKSKQDIQVAGFSGLLIELDQDANGKTFSKHILIYGDEKATTLINGVYLKDSSHLGKKINESILTTIVDLKIESNPRGALDYTLDETVGFLKFKSVIGNGMLFNRDLKLPTESVDQASLVTDMSFAKVDIANKKLFCISRMKKYPDDYSILANRGINEVEIDGVKGFELFAKNNDKETEEMYQVILFDDEGGYYVFIGTYLAGNQKAENDLKNVIKTFKRKR